MNFLLISNFPFSQFQYFTNNKVKITSSKLKMHYIHLHMLWKLSLNIPNFNLVWCIYDILITHAVNTGQIYVDLLIINKPTNNLFAVILAERIFPQINTVSSNLIIILITWALLWYLIDTPLVGRVDCNPQSSDAHKSTWNFNKFLINLHYHMIFIMKYKINPLSTYWNIDSECTNFINV